MIEIKPSLQVVTKLRRGGMSQPQPRALNRWKLFRELSGLKVSIRQIAIDDEQSGRCDDDRNER
jgi:hypothetical protein